MNGPSYLSATLVAQRFTLALLNDGSRAPPSPPSSSLTSSTPFGEGFSIRSEEIVRVVVDDVNIFVEVGQAARHFAATTRGNALVAVEVQDFSNFLRLPLLSHALVNWDVATCSGDTGVTADGKEDLLSPFRPSASAAIDVQDAVVSVSVAAMQCINQCIEELSKRPSGFLTGGVNLTTRESLVGGAKRPKRSPSAGSLQTPPQSTKAPLTRLSQPRNKRYVITNLTDRTLWFGQVSTTETLLLRAGEDTSYRWRTIPATFEGIAAGEKDGASRLTLMLRLALYRESVSGGGFPRAGTGFRGEFGAWTEPFPADHSGTFMVRGWKV